MISIKLVVLLIQTGVIIIYIWGPKIFIFFIFPKICLPLKPITLYDIYIFRDPNGGQLKKLPFI